MSLRILGLCGSLRAASFNRAVLRFTGDALGADAQFSIADIRDIPHYDGDLDGEEKPASVLRLSSAIAECDALLIATPEYNYGIPGVLKNAIDWVSRPAYRSVLAGKPAAIVGASPGAVGTARAQGQLRQILGGTLTPIFPHPEVLVGGVAAKVQAGALTDTSTREHLEKYAKAFAAWVTAAGASR